MKQKSLGARNERTLAKVSEIPVRSDIEWKRVEALPSKGNGQGVRAISEGVSSAGGRDFMNTMTYKGYIGQVTLDEEAGVFHGQVMNARDIITFQGRTVRELRKALKDSIEDYLEFCRERGEDPDKHLSGRFVLRIDPELHREVTIAAVREGKSLNKWVAERLEREVYDVRERD